jgi:hypothetical protein
MTSTRKAALRAKARSTETVSSSEASSRITSSSGGLVWAARLSSISGRKRAPL